MMLSNAKRWLSNFSGPGPGDQFEQHRRAWWRCPVGRRPDPATGRLRPTNRHRNLGGRVTFVAAPTSEMHAGRRWRLTEHADHTDLPAGRHAFTTTATGYRCPAKVP
jgi:hypothetical protein